MPITLTEDERIYLESAQRSTALDHLWVELAFWVPSFALIVIGMCLDSMTAIGTGAVTYTIFRAWLIKRQLSTHKIGVSIYRKAHDAWQETLGEPKEARGPDE